MTNPWGLRMQGRCDELDKYHGGKWACLMIWCPPRCWTQRELPRQSRDQQGACKGEFGKTA